LSRRSERGRHALCFPGSDRHNQATAGNTLCAGPTPNALRELAKARQPVRPLASRLLWTLFLLWHWPARQRWTISSLCDRYPLVDPDPGRNLGYRAPGSQGTRPAARANRQVQVPKGPGQKETLPAMPDPSLFDPRLTVSRDDTIAVVTFNRPERRNAFDLSMWRGLRTVMRRLSADDDLRCVVLRGAGGKAFCAGADIGAFAAERGSDELEAEYAHVLDESMQSIRLCQHPVVAMIMGYCLGGGAGIATMCDFRVGGEGMRMGITARNLGVWYPYAEIDPIVTLAGIGVASEMLIEGRIFTATKPTRRACCPASSRMTGWSPKPWLSLTASQTEPRSQPVTTRRRCAGFAVLCR
jgi:hypothetical protein